MPDATPSFAVITDSTSDISPEIAADLGITIVPLTVTIQGESFADGSIAPAEFFRRMNESPRLPTTSQPPVGAFVTAYERALETFDHVVSVHISNKLSGTVDSASSAAERFAGRVHVFDSLNLSWGLAWQAVDAARSASAGMPLETAMVRLETARERVRLIVGLDSLDNLSRGGRIGKVSKFFGSLLDLKVTLTVDPDGAFEPVARSRGDKAAMRHTLEWVARQVGDAPGARFAVGHAMGLERANWLADEIRKRHDVVELVIYEAGAVISTHTGPGWGVAVLPEPVAR